MRLSGTKAFCKVEDDLISLIDFVLLLVLLMLVLTLWLGLLLDGWRAVTVIGGDCHPPVTEQREELDAAVAEDGGLIGAEAVATVDLPV